jgi:transposase InsO family protein
VNNHKNARLTVHGRAFLVKRILEEGLRPREAAQAVGVSVRTAYKWLKRYQEEGKAGLENRSSRPHHCPHATSREVLEAVIERRKARQTYHHISQALGLGLSTLARLLARHGLNRLAHLEPAPPPQRYEVETPGGLLHLDIKKLGRFRKPGPRVTQDMSFQGRSRGAGWEFVHVAIDDASRIAFSTLLPDESGRSACVALLRAVRYYRTLGIRIQRVLTDNGSCYRSHRFQRLCRRLGIKTKRTRPFTPRTNGKAERFIQTALREWAYARAYDNSDQRAQFLPIWLHHYNWHRPHSSLGHLPPISRCPAVNNLVDLHTYVKWLSVPGPGVYSTA